MQSRGLGIAVAVACVATSSLAADWPDRPIRLLVGVQPGGAMDVTARAIATRLNASLGQPIIVESRPGAGGNIAAETVAKSKPDGNVLVVGSIQLAVNPAFAGKSAVDPLNDLFPVMRLVDVINVLVVHPSVPVASVKELIALSRARSLNSSHSGSGSAGHLAVELFNAMADTKIIAVPYKGGAPAMTDLLGGNVDIAFATASTAVPHIKTGRLKGLAVTTANRSAVLPDVPSVAEAGLPGFETNNWYGLFAPVRTPRPVVDRLNAEVTRILKMSEVKGLLLAQGIEPHPTSAEEFAAYVRSETAKWGRLVQTAGIKPD